MTTYNSSKLSFRQMQGVIAYMSHVEAFVTRIKIESSDQRPLILWIATTNEHVAAIWPLTHWKSSDQELQKERIFLPIKNLDPVAKTSDI